MARALTSQGVPLWFLATPFWPKSAPMPLPRGKRKQDGWSSMAMAVATALHSSASLEGCTEHGAHGGHVRGNAAPQTPSSSADFCVEEATLPSGTS